VPEKRVGHTASVIGERIFVFGGRGGKDMKPLKENGRIWVYDTRFDVWSFLDPVPGTPFPAARSYHSSVAIEKPQPENMKGVKVDQATELPAVGSIAEGAKTDEEKGGYGTVFVHAGCPATGRTGDLWGFDVRTRTWKEFPTAPGKPRGGTAIAVSKQRIYRYGGFNGIGEEGGELDFLELALETFDDKGGAGEVGVTAKGDWQTLNFKEEDMTFPDYRSVAGLQTITTGMGREYLVLMLGERDPSSQGHDGAGKFWGDVWTFQCPPQGMTVASFKDATWQALGRETGEGLWSPVAVADAEGVEGEDVHKLVPGERGWFASSSLGDLDVSSVMLWGGLNGKNEREDNGWILTFE
jgi:Kelch motif/Galactose oxidase, central domain